MFTFERPWTDQPDIPLVLCWIFLYSSVLVLDLAIRRHVNNKKSPITNRSLATMLPTVGLCDITRQRNS